jgi:hypothetical protein
LSEHRIPGCLEIQPEAVLAFTRFSPVGKASRKKSGRRAGAGPSRAQIESGTSQEQVQRRLAAALHRPGRAGDWLRQVAEQAAAAQSAADEAVAELWGGTAPVPAEVPRWEDGSLGDFFFSEPVIAGAAAAPSAAVAVLPPPERVLAHGDVREAIASLLIRAVVFDRLPAAGPAVGALVARLDPVIDGEVVTAPALVIGEALVEAARAVIAGDRIGPVVKFLEPVLDQALAPLGLSAGLTGGAVARALACAVAHAYMFTDPADTALLDQLDPDSTTSGNALETLVNDKLLAPPDALLTGLAVLAALAGLCRSNAVSVLAEGSRSAR